MFGEQECGEQGCGEVLGVDPASLGDEALLNHLDRLVAHQHEVEVAVAQCVGAVDVRGLWARDGALSAGAWLARRCGLGGAAARSLVHTMGRLRSLPATAEALAEGSLGLAKASLIARAANERTEAALAGDEARLVEEARAHTVDDTARLMASWKARADLDGPVPAEGGERSRLHVSRSFGGRYLLDGELDAEGGAIVANELDALAERIYRGESAEGEVRSTPSQRKAAALVEMARRSAAAEPRAPARPLLLVLADLETLARRAGRGAEIVGTGPISAEAARRLACEAGLSRVLTDAAGAILDLGLSTRTPSPAQRRALVIRDGGCRFPGCDRGAGWCQAHHITHWADGGLTDLINLLLLCRRHHRLVHEGGFGLARGPDGALVFTRPDGTVLAARPLVA